MLIVYHGVTFKLSITEQQVDINLIYKINEHDMEEWKEIEGFNHQISNIGNIRNLKFRLLKPSVFRNRNGSPYWRICIYNKTESKTFLLHRLVAEYFCEKGEG